MQLMSNQQSVNNRLAALENAVKEGHQLDAENDVMRLAPPMPREPQVHFANILTQHIRDLAP